MNNQETFNGMDGSENEQTEIWSKEQIDEANRLLFDTDATVKPSNFKLIVECQRQRLHWVLDWLNGKDVADMIALEKVLVRTLNPNIDSL